MTRGGLAQATGCHAETIRYYEKIGLMPEPVRSACGYRLYDRAARRRLRFILRGRELGFGIRELRGLLELMEGGGTCGEVYGMTVEHLGNVRARIADLRRLERTLAAMARRCEGGALPDCPVIGDLFADRAPGDG